MLRLAAAASHLVASVEACSADTPCDVDTGSPVTGPYEYPGTTEEHHLVVLVKTQVWVRKEHEVGLMVAVAPKQ
uniref:Secreted protein n=1 Tax=Tanacetum cinerariifolium TaxID=118510 RepID=A0A6L2LZQ7_TANCI|nr:hypothetical protein [Tanacetum cinerariifolium]